MKKFYLIALAALLSFAVACDNSQENVVNGDYNLELTSDNMVLVPATGGQYAITYTLDAKSGAEVSVATPDRDMVTAIDTSADGLVTITISANNSDEGRQCPVTVSYLKDSFTVIFKQSGKGDAPIVVDANTFIGLYYAERTVEGLGHYWIILSDDGFDAEGNVVAGGEFFRFDILGPLAEDVENIRIPDGTYTFDAANTFKEYSILNLSNSDYMYVDENKEGWTMPFVDATLVVEGNRFRLDAKVNYTQSGITINYIVNFEGDYKVEYKPLSESLSNLTSDVEIDLSNSTGKYMCYGDNWKCGFCNWYFTFECNDGWDQGVYLALELLTDDKLDGASGFVGHYTAGGVDADDKTLPLFGSYKFVSGHRIPNSTQMMGSLYQRYVNGKGVDQAPLYGGEIEITKNADDTHTIVINATDDATPAHNITLNWTGKLSQM